MKIIKKTIILTLLFVNILFAQWEKINVPNETWGTAWAIDASDSSTIIFSATSNEYLEPDILLLSIDGGVIWENISPLASWDESIIDVTMVDKNNIWIVTSGVDSARIQYTSDAGNTWQVQFNDSSKTKFFNYIEMFDANNGVAMGDAPESNILTQSDTALIVTTKDGGIHWEVMKNDPPIYASGDVWRRIDFVSPEIGYFTENWNGKENQGIKATINGGNSWELLLPKVSVQVLKFYSKELGIAYNNNLIRRTTDGGKTWKEFEHLFDGWGNDIEFLPGDPSKVWITTGRTGIFFSSDTGATWIHYDVSTTNEYYHGSDIIFVDNQHGWYISDVGDLFYTNNNGGLITDVKEEQKEKTPSKFALEQNYPNPFNPTTTIKYSIPNVETGNISSVRIIVYDVIGNEITELVNDQKVAGNYEATFDASKLSSGVYYYQLVAGEIIQTKKMILLK